MQQAVLQEAGGAQRDASWLPPQDAAAAGLARLQDAPLAFVSFANGAFNDFLANWVASIQRLGLPFVVGALDEKMADKAAALGWPHLLVGSAAAAGKGDAFFRANLTAFRGMGAKKVQLVLTMLEQYGMQTIVVSDSGEGPTSAVLNCRRAHPDRPCAAVSRGVAGCWHCPGTAPITLVVGLAPGVCHGSAVCLPEQHSRQVDGALSPLARHYACPTHTACPAPCCPALFTPADTTWLRDPSDYLAKYPQADWFMSTDCLSHQASSRARGPSAAPGCCTRHASWCAARCLVQCSWGRKDEGLAGSWRIWRQPGPGYLQRPFPCVHIFAACAGGGGVEGAAQPAALRARGGQRMGPLLQYRQATAALPCTVSAVAALPLRRPGHYNPKQPPHPPTPSVAVQASLLCATARRARRCCADGGMPCWTANTPPSPWWSAR